jgi:hypothetical protein
MPMRRIRSPCCARATSGNDTVAPPSSVMNSRRLIGSPPAFTAGRQALGSLRAPLLKPRSDQRISLTSIVLDAARINSKHKPILPDLNHAVADVAVRIMNTTTATEKARTPPSAPLTP